MAAKIGKPSAKAGDNVVKLPTRKAKGAGGAQRKPAAEGSVLKPRTDTVAPKSPPPMGDNKGPKPDPKAEERAIIQAQQDKLRGLTAKHVEIDARKKIIQASMDEENSKLKEVRAAIQNIGIPLAIFDESYEAIKLKTKRRDLEAYERVRKVVREAFGQPTEEQPDLLDNIPVAAQPAVHWEAEGYRDGISGEAYDLREIPPEHHQDYLRGFNQSQARNAEGLNALQAEAPAPSAAPLIPAEGEEGEEDDDDAAPTEAEVDSALAQVGTEAEAAVDAGDQARDDAIRDGERPPGTTDEEWEAAAAAKPSAGGEAESFG